MTKKCPFKQKINQVGPEHQGKLLSRKIHLLSANVSSLYWFLDARVRTKSSHKKVELKTLWQAFGA